MVVQRCGVSLGARHLKQLADQGIEAVGFLLDTVERAIRIVAGAGQFDGDTKPGQRRTEFVGDVQQQAAFGGEQGFDAVGHSVEGAGELAEFVAADALGAGGEIAAAEAFDGLLEFANRARKVQGQPVAEPDGGGHDKEVFRLQEPRADVGARHDEEKPVAAVVRSAGDGGIAACETPGRARRRCARRIRSERSSLVSRSRPFSSVRTPRAS